MSILPFFSQKRLMLLNIVHVFFACTIINKYYITLDDGLKASLTIIICLQIMHTFGCQRVTKFKEKYLYIK
jgi:hypothetical protein